jgi:hypothetical protein
LSGKAEGSGIDGSCEKDQQTCLDRPRRNGMAELLEVEVGMVARVGCEIPGKSKHVGQGSLKSRTNFRRCALRANAKTKKHGRPICVEFILRSFFLSRPQGVEMAQESSETPLGLEVEISNEGRGLGGATNGLLELLVGSRDEWTVFPGLKVLGQPSTRSGMKSGSSPIATNRRSRSQTRSSAS